MAQTTDFQNVTELEKDVLQGIINSEYGDAPSDPIWSWSIDCQIAKGKQISAACSSLAQKGLVDTLKDGKDSTIWITEAGIEVCKKLGLL